MTAVYTVSGNMVFEQVLTSQPRYWDHRILFLANGYVEALNQHMERLTDKEVARELSEVVEAFSDFLSFVKELATIDPAKFYRCDQFLEYWKTREININRYMNLV